jgi:hypothetical protein
MALISISKDSHSVVINPTKGKHPHLETLDNFYKTFAETRGDDLLEWLNREESGSETLKILEKLPFIKKLQEKITKLNYKDMNEIIDSMSLYKLSYQLKILNSEKNFKLTMTMIEKGFIPHVAKVLAPRKGIISSPEHYCILTNLLNTLSEMVKFTKASKNTGVGMITENFLIDLINISSH